MKRFLPLLLVLLLLFSACAKKTDVPDGNIDIETVREQLTEDTLEKARDDYYDEQLKGWVDALKPVFHAENWN